MQGQMQDGGQNLSYDEARELASHADPIVRAKLAIRTDVPPEILYFLSEDADHEVRCNAATNPALPLKAEANMVADPHPEVRTNLAMKLVQPANDSTFEPTITAASPEKMELLRQLCEDEITRVREVIAEALKDVVDAPHDIICALAGDSALSVAGPVLECSPVLTDEDLIEVLNAGPIDGAASAVAKRNGVSEMVSGIIAESGDKHAIASLLGNDSAQIREETLDSLVEQSKVVALWQAPLVARAQLPGGAARKLAGFVADHLLEQLKDRSDFDAETLTTLNSIVKRRLDLQSAGGGRNQASDRAKHQVWSPESDDLPLTEVEALQKQGNLSTRIISNALTSGDYAFVLAAIVVMTGLSETVVRRIFSERSGKGIVTLCHKAGLPMRYAIMIQQRMGHIPPSEVVSGDNPSVYPLKEDEMSWQISFFQDLVEGP